MIMLRWHNHCMSCHYVTASWGSLSILMICGCTSTSYACATHQRPLSPSSLDCAHHIGEMAVSDTLSSHSESYLIYREVWGIPLSSAHLFGAHNESYPLFLPMHNLSKACCFDSFSCSSSHYPFPSFWSFFAAFTLFNTPEGRQHMHTWDDGCHRAMCHAVIDSSRAGTRTMVWTCTCHDSDYQFLFLPFPLMTRSHLHLHSVFLCLLTHHHPM